MRLFKTPEKQSEKPVFKGDIEINGYPSGPACDYIGGRIFLFPGTVNINGQSLPALAISDWSNGSFKTAATSHSKYPIEKTDFVDINRKGFSPGKPTFVLYKPEAIQNFIQQLRTAGAETLLSMLEKLEVKLNAETSTTTSMK